MSRRTEILQAGVVGINKANDSFAVTDISVAAIAEIGDTMYIGGKFTQVETAADLQRYDQRFLAAFDRTTGVWIDTFRPTIDGNVWDLKATDDGRLIVAGQFTNVNGEPNTTGVAMIDPITGAVDPTWRATSELTGSTNWALARTLDIEGGLVYIGGNFTRITGTNGVETRAGQIARVSLATGNVDRSFLPNFDGVVFDIDATADRVYVAGNFKYVNDIWSIGIGVLDPQGALVPGLEPWVRTSVSNTNRSYQQAILSYQDQVWQVGSEHNRQAYRASDYGLIRSWVSHPYGDGQALAELNGIVYTGSHANGNTNLYQDAFRWPGLDGATSNKPIRWMGAFSTVDPEHLSWYPAIGSRTARAAGSCSPTRPGACGPVGTSSEAATTATSPATPRALRSSARPTPLPRHPRRARRQSPHRTGSTWRGPHRPAMTAVARSTTRSSRTTRCSPRSSTSPRSAIPTAPPTIATSCGRWTSPATGRRPPACSPPPGTTPRGRALPRTSKP